MIGASTCTYHALARLAAGIFLSSPIRPVSLPLFEGPRHGRVCDLPRRHWKRPEPATVEAAAMQGTRRCAPDLGLRWPPARCAPLDAAPADGGLIAGSKIIDEVCPLVRCLDLSQRWCRHGSSHVSS